MKHLFLDQKVSLRCLNRFTENCTRNFDGASPGGPRKADQRQEGGQEVCGVTAADTANLPASICHFSHPSLQPIPLFQKSVLQFLNFYGQGMLMDYSSGLVIQWCVVFATAIKHAVLLVLLYNMLFYLQWPIRMGHSQLILKCLYFVSVIGTSKPRIISIIACQVLTFILHILSKITALLIEPVVVAESTRAVFLKDKDVTEHLHCCAKRLSRAFKKNCQNIRGWGAELSVNC